MSDIANCTYYLCSTCMYVHTYICLKRRTVLAVCLRGGPLGRKSRRVKIKRKIMENKITVIK